MEPKRHSEIIDSLFTYRKVDELEQYLENNPQLNIIALTDTQGNNVLHQLAYEGQQQLIRVFVRKVILRLKRKQESEQRLSRDLEQKEFKHWINQRNNEGFTPLLYASYSGHLQIIKYLVDQHSADINIKTNTGLNPLHLAAQKNMIMPFLYFRNKIDLYALDDLKSTPLHWAAYTNNEEVVSYILADTDNNSYLNIKDQEGNTPLNLAVAYGNTRIVRRLLIKGANRYIRNDDAKIPLEVAIQSEFKTITKMLDQKFSILDNIKFYCNIKIQYKPKRRKFTIPLLFLITFFLNLFIINFFLQITQDYALYTEVAFMFIMLCFYLSLLFNKPTSQPKDMNTLHEEYNERTIKKICFICKNKIPKRGYHCDTCGVCIEQYDHHCTWINNCVGKRNLARFIFFILMLTISLGFIGFISILATISLIDNNPTKFEHIFTFRFLQKSTLQKYCLIGCFLVNEVTSLFIVPVLMLVVVQIRNLFLNKTTFQKLRGPNEDQPIKSKMSKQGKVSLRNCQVMCSNTRGSFTTTRSSVGELITEKFPSERNQILENSHQ